MHGQFGVLHGRPVAAQPLGGRVDARLVTDEPDAAMAVGDEVGHAGPGAAVAVGQDDVRVDLAGGTVDEHRCDACLDLGLQVAVVVSRRNNDQSVHPSSTEGECQLLFPFGVFGARSVDEQGAVRSCHFLHRAAQGTVEGVRQVLKHQTDGGSSALAQDTGAVVAPEPQGIDGFLHPSFGLDGDPGFAVHYARHGLQTDSCTRSDVLHRGPNAVARLR